MKYLTWFISKAEKVVLEAVSSVLFNSLIKLISSPFVNTNSDTIFRADLYSAVGNIGFRLSAV